MLERWVAHLLAVAVSIRTRGENDDARWVWHVGLDAQASALPNDLYNRTEVDTERMKRLLCLFELRFADPAAMRPALAGIRFIWRWPSMQTPRLALKPQNLLLNLPLTRPQ